ncbi:hypothetical protein E4U41_002842 [Claviceps citrina]|nr:hypothetical protein E4U41_002842 [Claviceps citrina]
MSLKDIPWLSYQASQANMAEPSIPLEDIAPHPRPVPPPEYSKSAQRDAPEAVHNHYHIGHDGRGPTPWYRRKWAFWTMVGLLVFFVLAGLIIMGVMLKVQLGKKEAADAQPASTRPVSITGTAASPTRTSTSQVGTTATPFTMLEKSQLASAYVKAKDASLNRRLLIRQEDTNDLLVTEWTKGQVAHYRIGDKLSSLLTEAKPGTPLALQADSSGSLHLFYLSRSNVLSHVYQTTAGKWQTGEVTNEDGPIRTSTYSSLSAAWHNGLDGAGLLVVAYDNDVQKLQLVMTSSPTERALWYTSEVTSVAVDSTPGQSNVARYSLAGDWFSDEDQRLLIAISEGSEVHAWECSIAWPPPHAQVQCKQNDAHFRDGRDKGLILVPGPTQFAWINLSAERRGASSPNYDFTLLSLDGSGTVRENLVGTSLKRGKGQGFTAEMSLKAISTTSESMVFASSGKDVFVYGKFGTRWQPDVETSATL